MPADADFPSFPSGKMKLARLSHTRPDVRYEDLQATQVADGNFSKGKMTYMKRSNNAIKYVLENKATIESRRLDKS